MVNREILESVQDEFNLSWRELASMFNLSKSHYFKTLSKRNEAADQIEMLLLRFEEKSLVFAQSDFRDPEFAPKMLQFTNAHEEDLNIKRASLHLKKMTLTRQLADMEKKYERLSMAIHRLTWVINHPEHLSAWQLHVIENNRDNCFRDLEAVTPGRQLELKAKLAGVSAELEVLLGES